MAIRKKRTIRKKVVKRVFRGSTKNAVRKNALVKRVRKVVARKKNRQDIHQIVRDHIRAGRNQKQILDLMKRAGFKKEYLAEARKIYNSEKQLVRRMKTGRDPKKPIIAKYYVGKGWRKAVWDGIKYVGEGPYFDSPEKLKIRGFGKAFTKRIISKKRRNPKAGKILSTVKRVAVKAGKTAIGAVKGAIKGGAKAAKGNPPKLTDQEIILLRAAFKVDPAGRSGALMSVRDILRKTRLPWPTATKKRLIKGLIEKGIFAAHRHDYPGSLSYEERRDMIAYKGGHSTGSGKHTYYIGVAMRDPYLASSIPDLAENPKRRRNSPIAEQQRKQFAGHFDGYRDLYYPSTNPPKEPSKLGELKSIRTSKADFTPMKGSMWLCRDSAGRLHIGTTREGEMFAGPVQDLGKVERIEYLERKPHLEDYQLTEYYHRMGEENGVKPHLWSDGKGGLVFKGGDYRIESRGIVN